MKRVMKPTPNLTVISTKDWDDEIAKLKLAKALGGLKMRESEAVRYGRIYKALHKALETSDCPVIADTITAALFNAFEQGMKAGAVEKRKAAL